jgi:hypothetical protein
VVERALQGRSFIIILFINVDLLTTVLDQEVGHLSKASGLLE